VTRGVEQVVERAPPVPDLQPVDAAEAAVVGTTTVNLRPSITAVASSELAIM
jgi:hypothetical protein